MRDARINAWVDLLAFISAVASIVTGYVLWFYFPLGSGRGSMDLITVSYQTWYDLHFYASTLFVILIAVHLILHYRWIRKLRPMLMSKK
jgi:uncharacterized iron-regulated membrane protein